MTFYNEYSVDSKVVPEEHVPETLLHVHRLTRLSDIGNDQAYPADPCVVDTLGHYSLRQRSGLWSAFNLMHFPTLFRPSAGLLHICV
jgi:hypothetical protein